MEDLKTLIWKGGQACAELLGDLEREWVREGYSDEVPRVPPAEESFHTNSPSFTAWVKATRRRTWPTPGLRSRGHDEG